MKNKKLAVSVGLVIALGFAWFAFISGEVGTYRSYQNHRKLAQQSMDRGLYEQAIEEYKKVLDYRQNNSTWQNIKQAYEKLYAENGSDYVRECYIRDMAKAAEAYPKIADYWKTQLDLYLQEDNYSRAYAVAKEAMKVPVKDDQVKATYKKLLYMVKTDYDLYPEYKTCLNGYISVYDGNVWRVMDETGEILSGDYEMIGLINDEGKGIYRDKTAVWLMDKDEVARERYDLDITDAGYYSESLDLVPVEINGSWRYLKGDGSFLPGEYETAGSFYNGQAAVKKDNVWFFIDQNGERVSDHTFEEIKLDLYGCHQQGKVILAKENGLFHIYNEKLEQVSDFSCEDMDICIDGGLIAFRQGEKWGYVNEKGETVIEPAYQGAKSFSHGMAAVKGEDGLWGFLNRDYELVIPYQYLDAGYFTSRETCMVSGTENNYQMQHYRFED